MTRVPCRRYRIARLGGLMFRLKDTARRRFIVDIVVNVEGPDIVASMFSRQPIATTTNVQDITANNQSQKMLYVLSYHRANSYKQSHGPLESLPNCLTRVCNVRLSSRRGCFNARTTCALYFKQGCSGQTVWKESRTHIIRFKPRSDHVVPSKDGCDS